MTDQTIKLIIDSVVAVGGTGKDVAYAYFAYQTLMAFLIAGTILLIAVLVMRFIKGFHGQDTFCGKIAESFNVYQSYGPVRGLTPENVAEICKILDQFKRGKLFTEDEAISKGWSKKD